MGHEKECLDLRLQLAVHQRHLELVLKVGYGPQPPDNGLGLLPAGEIDEQPLEMNHADIRHGPDHFADQRDALLIREEAGLGFIDGNGHNDLVKKPGSPMDDIKVPVGDGVKTAGIDGASHNRIKRSVQGDGSD